MSTDTPRPERVTLADDREGLVATITRRLSWSSVHWFPTRTRGGIKEPVIDAGIAPAIADAVLGSAWLAAREKALREEIAGEVERKAQHLNAAEDYGRGGRDGLNAAARIARGGTR